MLLQTNWRISHHYRNDPLAMKHAREQLEHVHMEGIVKKLHLSKSGPTMRIKTFDEELRETDATQGWHPYAPDIGKSPFGLHCSDLVLTYSTLITFMSPLLCPVGGFVADNDFRNLFVIDPKEAMIQVSYPHLMEFWQQRYRIATDVVVVWERRA